MAGLIAPVDDKGNLVTKTESGDSLTKKGKNNNIVDSDTFLTLLVAEMQNQDPLEPTSNTEWVSQYATFTQVQQLSEMGNAMDQLRANSMVGKEVVMKVTSESTGEVSYKDGIVEYVLVENGKTMLVIDGDKYSIDDLDSVLSDEYSEALGKYREWKAKFSALPSLQFVNDQYEGALKELFDDYYAMDDYQKSFMEKYAADYLDLFQQYLAKLQLYGIEFETPSGEEEDKTTLDDILDNFNQKMDEILEKLGSLSAAGGSGESSSGAEGSDSVGGDAGSTGDAENVENAGGTGNTGSADETEGSEKADGTNEENNVDSIPKTEDSSENNDEDLENNPENDTVTGDGGNA